MGSSELRVCTWGGTRGKGELSTAGGLGAGLTEQLLDGHRGFLLAIWSHRQKSSRLRGLGEHREPPCETDLVIVLHTSFHMHTHALRPLGGFPILQLSRAPRSSGNARINHDLLSQCQQQPPASVPRVQRAQSRAVYTSGAERPRVGSRELPHQAQNTPTKGTRTHTYSTQTAPLAWSILKDLHCCQSPASPQRITQWSSSGSDLPLQPPFLCACDQGSTKKKRSHWRSAAAA